MLENKRSPGYRNPPFFQPDYLVYFKAFGKEQYLSEKSGTVNSYAQICQHSLGLKPVKQ